MVKALFYKEWIKTRRSIWLAIALLAGACAYAFIDTAQAFRVDGAIQVWNAVITKDAPMLPGVIQWLPAIAGLLVALSQFIPEMADKRLKLTLHLPMRENRIVAATLAYGTATLLGLFGITYAVLAAGFSVWYPVELIAGMCMRSLSWFLAGMCAYLLAAWVCLEPVWRQRILYSLAAVCLCAPFFIGAPSGAFAPFAPYLVAFTIICFTFPFYSAARFKDGAQS